MTKEQEHISVELLKQAVSDRMDRIERNESSQKPHKKHASNKMPKRTRKKK